MHAALWIGDAALAEFAPTAELLRRHLRLTVVPTIDDALFGADVAEYDVIILAEAMPGRTPPGSLDRLRRRHAAAPIVRLCGPLCDGELRSSPPETAHRYHWLDAPERFAEDCAALERGDCPSWGRPVTFGSEEGVLEAVAEKRVASLAGLRIGVDACDSAIAAWLREFIRSRDAFPASPDAAASAITVPDVVVWQAPVDGTSAGLARIRDSFPRAGIVVLTAFPRRQPALSFKAAGAGAVVALPALPGRLDRALAVAAKLLPAGSSDGSSRIDVVGSYH